jgi:hypothetical protein
MEPTEKFFDEKTKNVSIFIVWSLLFAFTAGSAIISGILLLLNNFKLLPDNKLFNFIVPYMFPAFWLFGVISIIAYYKTKKSKYFMTMKAEENKDGHLNHEINHR